MMEVGGIAVVCVLLGVPFLVGYRLGHARGLATWRMDYQHMSRADIAEHQRIIQKMRKRKVF